MALYNHSLTFLRFIPYSVLNVNKGKNSTQLNKEVKPQIIELKSIIKISHVT